MEDIIHILGPWVPLVLLLILFLAIILAITICECLKLFVAFFRGWPLPDPVEDSDDEEENG